MILLLLSVTRISSGGSVSGPAPSFAASPSTNSNGFNPDASMRDVTPEMVSALVGPAFARNGPCRTRAWPPDTQNDTNAIATPAIQNIGPPREGRDGAAS